MPQALRTTNDLINNAFYMLGEFSPNRIPESRDVATGLYILNDMFDYYGTRGVRIPIFREITFTMTPGKGDYTVSNVNNSYDVNAERIIEIDFANVVYNEVSYPVKPMTEAIVKNRVRWDNLESWPEIVWLDKEVLYSTLHFYPKPSLAFECIIKGKFMLDHLELHDQLDEIPPNYNRFLRYALARELKEYYPSSNWSGTSEKEYQIMLSELMGSAEVDVTLRPSGILLNNYGGYIRYFNGVSG